MLKSDETEVFSGTVILDANWKEVIRQAYEGNEKSFYSAIWDMSLNAFDIGREVQVLIDKNDNLFISVGNPGFVSFQSQEYELYNKEAKMTFPLKEWIHTHPFGKAFFSGTDLKTIATYRRHMVKATVLGDGERMAIEFDVGPNGEDYQEFVQHALIGDEEE